MKNISEMAERLNKLAEDIIAGTADLKAASELNNTFGKHLKVYQLQLGYHALRGEAPNIPYLAAASVMKKTVKAIEAQPAIDAIEDK